MAITQFKFSQVGYFDFPYSPTGGCTALSMCIYKGDPALAFLTQTTLSDDIVYLHSNLKGNKEQGKYANPPGKDIISGMAYDVPSKTMILCQGTNNFMNMFTMDPDTGTVKKEIPLTAPPPTTPVSGIGLAWNGSFAVRIYKSNAASSELEAIDTSGNSLGTVVVPGAELTGICSAGGRYLATDKKNHRVVMLNVFGEIVGEAPALGTQGGLEAIAFDHVTADWGAIANFPTATGAPGPLGSPTHPATAWKPTPWIQRHRIYYGNRHDLKIYFGYLYL